MMMMPSSLSAQQQQQEEDGRGVLNWSVWNQDESLNFGLVVFAFLCAACAAVWTALLLQCAALGCERFCGSACTDRQRQFIPVAFYDSEDEDGDDPKAAKKKQRQAIVVAADFVDVKK